ncbi:hypothetical protein HA402_006338 [Bradysia odoriphaga]|nr:hypothetical protein HA402_006338 [Bradysia odoriphaga]
MTSSSAPILYPTLKGLESSNSSFVQVSQPIREVNRNLTSNHRNSASIADRGYKTKQPKPHEYAKRSDDFAINRRQQREYTNRAPILSDKDVDSRTEPNNRYGETSDADFRTKLKVEKSQQYDIDESRIMTTDHSSKEKERQLKEIAELSLMKPESVQGLINKHPKHTIIINNTFINRPPTEQDEFLAKFSPTFYSQNPNVVSVRDVLPSVTENDTNHIKPLADGVQEEISKPEADRENPSPNVENSNVACDDPNDRSPSVDESLPLGSIITAILWLVLILFWLLLYLKVVNVYHPLPKVMPKPEPTNFELCLLIIRKLRSFIFDLWRFW